MGRAAMIVVGVGFRAAAPLASLREAVEAALAGRRADLLATVEEKANAPVLLTLAAEMGVPVRPLPAGALAGVTTPTQSARSEARLGTGSLAEAAALVASGGTLTGSRVQSADGMATAAVGVRGT